MTSIIELLRQAAFDGVIECPECGNELEPDAETCCECGWTNVLTKQGFI